jgi:hypothetical protein
MVKELHWEDRAAAEAEVLAAIERERVNTTH